jgi:hypothetical protein
MLESFWMEKRAVKWQQGVTINEKINRVFIPKRQIVNEVFKVTR